MIYVLHIDNHTVSKTMISGLYIKTHSYYKSIKYHYQNNEWKDMKKYIKLLIGENEDMGFSMMGFYYQQKDKYDKIF